MYQQTATFTVPLENFVSQDEEPSWALQLTCSDFKIGVGS